VPALVTDRAGAYDRVVSSTTKSFIARPEARTMSVEDLVATVLAGTMRIPVFQRGIAWESKDVLALFDSIYRGFPIGSLLLREGSAEAAEVTVGPLKLIGAERADAWWVVDGQQRLTALAAALGRPGSIPRTPVDPFVVYFDAVTEEFVSPPKDGSIPSTWVPLPRLLDGASLMEWAFTWPHVADVELRTRVFEAGKRLREFKVPLNIVRTDDESLLRTIFTRVNSNGKALKWTELHDGLFGHKGAAPSSLTELADALEKLGMGRPTEDELLPCLVAYQGLDVTRSFHEHLRRDPGFLDGVAARAVPVLRTLLGFLRTECAIEHLRFLPYSTPLVILTRFFKEHPRPNERSSELLVRWVWRTIIDTEHDDRALRRKGIAAITSDEEGSVQRLLEVARRQRLEIVLPSAFDARSARSRIVLLAMASLHPLHLDDGAPIDVSKLVQAEDVDAFRAVFPGGAGGPANRILLPGAGSALATLRDFIEKVGGDHPALRSHAIDSDVAMAIRDGDATTALAKRTELLRIAAQSLGDKMAAWGRSDRPSLEYLLQQAAP